MSLIGNVKNRDYIGRKVCLKGWVYRKRAVGGKVFIVLRDSSDIVQCVIDKGNVDGRTWKEAEKITRESSCIVEGVVSKEPRAPGGFEIKVYRLRTIGLSDWFPIKGTEGVDYLLDHRHLWIRSRKLQAVMKIKHTVLEAGREYFNKNGWWEVTPPIITGSACESGATQFEINYFDQKAYLSQSAQLYLEVLVYALDKVWALTPSFRAEKSRTRRHLAEYWHLEPEAAWYGMEDIMRVAEELTYYIIDKVLNERRKELELLKRRIDVLENAKPPYPKITYDEAIEILQKKGVDIKWGEDLGADEERILTEEFDKPFFITHFPKEIKAFYMKLDPKNPKVVLGFDLLAPEGYGEVIGGSVREDSYELLYKRIIEAGLNPKEYKWYLDLRKYGSVPHSGFGLGIERIVMWIASLDHIRDAIPFPRFRERLYP